MVLPDFLDELFEACVSVSLWTFATAGIYAYPNTNSFYGQPTSIFSNGDYVRAKMQVLEQNGQQPKSRSHG